MNRMTWRLAIIALACVVAAIFLYPSFSFYRLPREEQDRLRERRNPIVEKILNLGLDLQGGMHVVLELQTEKLPDDKPATVREAVERAMEIIRNRVDAMGLAEPLIVSQGEKWIVVQIPGVKDRERAKELIGRTALLEFRIVESEAASIPIMTKAREMGLDKNNLKPGQTPEAIRAMLPPGTELLAGRDRDELYAVRDKAEMTGSSLVNARVDLAGSQTGFPVVELEFNAEGAKRFGDVTAANVERQLAIVLDGVVQSAPVIRQAIPDGRAQIEGNFSPEEARLLKTVLQAGALPAPLEVVEERTVGSTLGDDSIRSGMMACAIGMGLVFVFMMVYYKWSGVLANMALILNLFLLLAAMAMLRATLTLPGIAGIILTLGMAVDANVLILERIREELRSGKTPRLAIDQGYEKAFSAIFDGNLTTLVAAAFLFQFGTGPIKGFGVSLILGLLISMFTAIVVTHTFYDLWLLRRPVEKLSV
jgi:protein-export membrane protein SecD